MSGVRCQVSGVRCQVSHVSCNFLCVCFLDKVGGLVGGGSVINRANPSLGLKGKFSLEISLV